MKNFVYGEEDTGIEQNLPISLIVLPPYQPRLFFDEQKLDELAQNIKINGILNRLIVRRILGTDQYELVAGGRRFRAAQKIGLTEVPVVVKKLSDSQALAIAITENLQREDLNPVEETEGIIKLLALSLNILPDEVPQFLTKMYNDSKRKSDHEQNVLFTELGQVVKAVFHDLGKISWESFVSSRLPLLNLPTDILEALRQGRIEYTKAIAISKVKDEVMRQELLEEAITHQLSLTQIRSQIGNSRSFETKVPQKAITDLSRKLKQSQLWKKDQAKWQKVQALIEQIDTLLDS
ncbi:ParB/RepB/Spo0J family partition protein [Chroococcus sp. FPU101]|uniref:ParB/RepB/Spo0J family partition protein n=1 Tax=Chroococcus sp. FPU101 TaxID=1974212 RepID=UPI001A90C4AF|nr:ParB/RepB/Spo0J family partition protein [Chroococcus sp. FPU101]GFE69090.1 chromosome partitioning protein, ParB family [Chroococcus sp. FPU101]